MVDLFALFSYGHRVPGGGPVFKEAMAAVAETYSRIINVRQKFCLLFPMYNLVRIQWQGGCLHWLWMQKDSCKLTLPGVNGFQFSVMNLLTPAIRPSWLFSFAWILMILLVMRRF